MSDSMTPKGRNSQQLQDARSSADLDDQAHREALTCSVLCSLMKSSRPDPPYVPSMACDRESVASENDQCDYEAALSSNDPTKRRSHEHFTDYESLSLASSCDQMKRRSHENCTDHLQLPMFLSKTYHMIDRCDNEIAMWSENGDNFVVKNVEKFASHVLPLYFKHSNFSSFARQLNFYGFRKLRSDPILTSDVDPCTSCYVRFYHEKFQRGKPELLQHIKRATKADQHSKDDIESLRNELAELKDSLRITTEEYDRKLADLSYECNRRITAMNAEYDNLAALVHRLLGALQSPSANVLTGGLSGCQGGRSASSTTCTGGLLPSVTSFRSHSGYQPSSVNTANVAGGTISASANPAIQLSVNSDLLQSLSQAAVSLQNTLRTQQNFSTNSCEAGKRPAAECRDGRSLSPPCRRNRES